MWVCAGGINFEIEKVQKIMVKIFGLAQPLGLSKSILVLLLPSKWLLWILFLPPRCCLSSVVN